RRGTSGEEYVRGVDLYRGAWQFVHPDRPLAKHRDHAHPADGQTAVATVSNSPSSDTAEVAERMKVMTYNIHSCIGIDGKIRPERIISVIRSCRADVIALQEVDANRHRSRRHEQARMIADALAMSHHYYAV